MSIVSHNLTSSIQADGGTSNVLRMYGEDGTEYTQVFYAPAGFTMQTKLDNTIAGMNEQLAAAEFETLVVL